MNVALTRARKKLVIIGSRSTLVGGDIDKVAFSQGEDSLLGRLIELLDERNWIITLPPDAQKIHALKTNLIVLDGDDNDNADGGRKSKKAGVVGGLLKSRPLLKDVAQGI